MEVNMGKESGNLGRNRFVIFMSESTRTIRNVAMESIAGGREQSTKENLRTIRSIYYLR